MIQGITERRGKRFAIGKEFFLVALVPRDIFFVHAVVTHQTPFVMIACKPNFEHVVKRFVCQNLLFGQMTMVIENRHIFCVREVQLFRRFVRQ